MGRRKLSEAEKLAAQQNHQEQMKTRRQAQPPTTNPPNAPTDQLLQELNPLAQQLEGIQIQGSVNFPILIKDEGPLLSSFIAATEDAVEDTKLSADNIPHHASPKTDSGSGLAGPAASSSSGNQAIRSSHSPSQPPSTATVQVVVERQNEDEDEDKDENNDDEDDEDNNEYNSDGKSHGLQTSWMFMN